MNLKSLTLDELMDICDPQTELEIALFEKMNDWIVRENQMIELLEAFGINWFDDVDQI